MPRILVCTLVLAAACADGHTLRITQENRTGWYRFSMTAPAIDYALQPTELEGPDITPACCLGFWDRDGQSFELYLGNWVEDPTPGPDGECPPVASIRLAVPVTPSDLPQQVDLAGVRFALATSGAADCPHYADGPRDEQSDELVISGHLDFNQLAVDCGDFDCALTTGGGFTLTIADSTGATVLAASGGFAAADDVLTE